MHFHKQMQANAKTQKQKIQIQKKASQKTHNIINTNIRMSRLYISHCILVAIDILSNNIFTNYV